MGYPLIVAAPCSTWAPRGEVPPAISLSTCSTVRMRLPLRAAAAFKIPNKSDGLDFEVRDDRDYAFGREQLHALRL